MQDRKKQYERDKLQAELAAKMKTIMIGAISSVEEKLGDLWGFGKKRPLTQSEQEFSDLFQELRKDILDKGNTQIRNTKQLLEQYNIEYEGYSLEIRLPVVRKE